MAFSDSLVTSELLQVSKMFRLLHWRFQSQVQKIHSRDLLAEDKCVSEAMRIGCIIIFHLGKLWKATFFILCDVIFLLRLQGKFEIGSERANVFFLNTFYRQRWKIRLQVQRPENSRKAHLFPTKVSRTTFGISGNLRWLLNHGFWPVLVPSPQKPDTSPPPDWSTEPSEVEFLTDKTFDAFIQDNPSVMVFFYSPSEFRCLRLPLSPAQ